MGTNLDISPDMTPEQVLAHYGVPGMQWGKRKVDDSGGSSTSRAERKALDKAAKREDNLKLTKSKQKPQNADDKEILDARARMNRVEQQYRDAKSTYKVEKQQIGKVAAKRALNEAKDRKVETLAKADELTKAERKVYNSILVGESISAIITGDLSKIDSSNTFNDWRRRVQAIREVENYS